MRPMEIFRASDASQPLGQIVQSAQAARIYYSFLMHRPLRFHHKYRVEFPLSTIFTRFTLLPSWRDA